MLKPPNRPRAPSAATLRVLYKLAYISSGAAVGVGALCAEERRRRTQIVQRVADNAKRIRQSPRYAHGAAAAAVREQEYEDNFGWGGPDLEIEETRQIDGGGRRARRLENHHEGAKMPELPSVVDEEYGRLIQRNDRDGKRRIRTGRPHFVEKHKNRRPLAKEELDERGAWKPPSLPIRHIPQAKDWDQDRLPPHKSLHLGSEVDVPWAWAVYRRPRKYGLPVDDELERASKRRLPLVHASAEGRNHRCSESDYDGLAKQFETRDFWNEPSSNHHDISQDSLARDLNVFFGQVTGADERNVDVRHAGRIADYLLELSLELECSEHIESLLLWKIAAHNLVLKDLFSLTAGFTAVARSFGPVATVQLFSDLFVIPTYLEAKSVDRLRLNLSLCAEALKFNASAENDRLFETLTSSLSIPKLKDAATVVELIGRECRGLMESNHIPSAVSLWCLAIDSGKYKAKNDVQLGDDLFNAALHSRHLSLCARILRVKDARGSGDHNHMKDDLIKICFNDGSIGLLRSLFQTKAEGGLTSNKNLSPQSYAYLSRCFPDRADLYSAYYNRVPQHLRDSVLLNSVTEGAAALKANWKATRDVHAVRESYKRMTNSYSRRGMESDSLRPLHVAMIEVELSANQSLKSIAALSSLQNSNLSKTRQDGTIATLTAVALAKQQNWTSFGQLFEVLRTNGQSMCWDPSMKRAFNNALHLFARSHSAQQLSDFFNMAISELRFRPNASSWEILLTGLVSKKAMTLLQYWIDFTDRIGDKLKLGPELGAALLKRWYLDSRHSHVMVMWLCRNLAEAAPLFQGNALFNNVREALAYDLRNLAGPNAPWMERILRARQTLIESSTDVAPKPGYVRDGQLFDQGRLLTAGEPLSQRPASHEEVDGWDILQHQVVAARNVETKPLPATAIPLDGAMRESNIVAKWDSSQQDPYEIAEDMRDAEALEREQAKPGFDGLRAQYEVGLAENDSLGEDYTLTKTENLERRAMVLFSLKQYESVLELYNNSLDAVGLPASPMLLEVATESSLRSNDRQEAESIMSAARDAGMNVTCAMGPLLIDQIANLSRLDRQGAADLRIKTIDYYRMNEQNGIHVKHHLATMAAHALIRFGFAEHGVNLLHSIRRSSWCADGPLDIAAMSVWLSGYAALGHKEGIIWVIEEVLDRGLNIDQGFLGTLRRARRPTHRLADGSLGYGRQDPELYTYLRRCYVVCAQRRKEQLQESKVFGRKLVQVLAKAAGKESKKLDIESAESTEVGRRPFGEKSIFVEPCGS